MTHKVECWSVDKVDWMSLHHCVKLKDPANYVLKLKKRGIMARITDLDTGEQVCSPGGELL